MIWNFMESLLSIFLNVCRQWIPVGLLLLLGLLLVLGLLIWTAS